MIRLAITRPERGATAIFVAILATLLLTMAALSVDLGNAWARKRDVQTQVDVSALSAGHLLPAKTTDEINAVAAEVARYLNTENNQAIGQLDVNAGDLRDGSFDNGEIEITNEGKRLRVVAPGARVDFSFAGVIGSDAVNVQAEATVELQSKLPPLGDVLPFAVPDGCPFGPGMADTGPGKTPTNTAGTFEFSSAREGTVDGLILSQSPIEGGQEEPVTASVTLGNLKNNTTLAETSVLFQKGGAGYYVAPSAWTPSGNTSNPSDKTRTMSVLIPQEVIDGPGTWYVHGYIGGKHTTADSAKSFAVGDFESTNEVGCDASSSGQFGQLYSPRGNQNPDQRGLALNIAEGIDHTIWPFDPSKGTADPECGKKNSVAATGGVHDKVDAVAPNCVLPQTGNDGPWMLQGLITGLDDGVKGRLDASRPDGETTCGPNSGRDAEVQREGVFINNDVLSCFLKPGYFLRDLTDDDLTEEEASLMLDPKVTKSPRFMWIPIIYPETRVEIDNNTFFKVRRFVPAFLTDETSSATQASSDASADNGVVIRGRLESLRIFMLNPLTLPEDERSLTTNYDPLLGRTITLID